MDNDNTLMVMITEKNYGIEKLLDNSSSSCQKLRRNFRSVENSAKMCSERNTMVTIRDGVKGSDEWYLNSGCSTHMKSRKD